MSQAILRETLRHVQDLIAKETGTPLQGDAGRRLEHMLSNAIARSAKSSRSEKFASREVTILLADLRGFSSISDTYPAGIVLELLNRYLSTMSEIVIQHEGTIDKFMGDSIMVLFGARDSAEDNVRRALTCAVDMQIAMDELNGSHKRNEIPEIYMGIGINTGTVMAGLVGSDLYSEYTVIGDEVNLASRIEAFSLRGQVLIGENTFRHCWDFVTTGEPMEVYVKGKTTPVNLREVLAVPSLGKQVPRQEIRRSPRVRVEIPFVYRVVRNKIVIPESYRGTVLDISYHGVQAELAEPLDPHSEIKLDLDLSLIGYKAADIYARILRTRPPQDRHAASIEFTSIGVRDSASIKHFVQLLVQGSENR